MLGFLKKTPFCSAVIVAAGSARRMGGTDKIMADLNGHPVIWHTIRAFQENPDIQQIVVVTRSDLLVPLAEKCRQWGFSKVTAVMLGGQDRLSSVTIGADSVSGKADCIAVHDGARPLVSQAVISDTVKKCFKFGAAAPAIPVKDTVKICKGNTVESTPDRKSLMAVQTPQIFDADLLRGALAHAAENSIPVTDDCSCVEAMGMRVVLTEGEERNLKITTPMDLEIARLWLKGEK